MPSGPSSRASPPRGFRRQIFCEGSQGSGLVKARVRMPRVEAVQRAADFQTLALCVHGCVHGTVPGAGLRQLVGYSQTRATTGFGRLPMGTGQVMRPSL